MCLFSSLTKGNLWCRFSLPPWGCCTVPHPISVNTQRQLPLVKRILVDADIFITTDNFISSWLHCCMTHKFHNFKIEIQIIFLEILIMFRHIIIVFPLDLIICTQIRESQCAIVSPEAYWENGYSPWKAKRQLDETINKESMRHNICAEVILQCYHLHVIRTKVNIFF